MSAQSWALLILLSILWGGSFFFAKVAVAVIPPATLVLLRVLIAALALHVVLAARGIPFSWSFRALGPYFVLGLINNIIPFFLLFWGQREIASGLAAILNAFTPIATVIVAHILTTDEKATPLKTIGVLFGFFGVAAMIGIDALAGVTDHVMAQLACIGATISYAFAAVYARRFKGENPFVVSTGQLTASSIIMIPLAAMVDQPWTLTAPGIGVWTSVILLAVLSTAFAYVLYFRVIALAGATNGALVTFLVPISAIGLGILFLDEVLAQRHIIGLFLIGIGLAAIDGRPFKLFASKKKAAEAASP